MSDDAEYFASRAMAGKAAAAPLAMSTGEIDFACNACPLPRGIVLRALGTNAGNLSHEFMAGCSTEAIISALKFQIGGADPRGNQPDACKPRRNAGYGSAANLNASGFEMNRDHPEWGRYVGQGHA